MEATVANEALSRLDKVRDLPTLPMVAQKVGRVVRSTNADAKQVAGIMEDDPAIMTRILKVVNSALYAGSEKVTSVQHAVARMGMRTVSNIAMSTSVFSAFGKGDGAFDREDFWRHSISTGIAAVVIYDRAKQSLSKRIDPDDLRLAGLMHDMGKIVFDQYFHDEFIEALRVSESDKIPLFKAERDAVGLDHSLAGAWLATKWNLSDELAQVIRRHHDPDRAKEEHWEMVALCHTANYICNLQGIGNSGTGSPTFDQSVWKRLGLTAGDVSDVVDQINEESNKSEILMSFVKE